MEWNVQFWRPHRTGGTQNCLKNYPCLWRNFSNLITWNRVMAWNGQFWRQHRVLSMQNNCLKSFVCEGIIQIWQHGTELWHQLFKFKDNMQVLCNQTWHSILKIAYVWWHSNWLSANCLQKIWPLPVKELLKSDHLEQSYRIKYWILKIT